MDTDFDESMDAFRKPSGCARKKTISLTKKVPEKGRIIKKESKASKKSSATASPEISSNKKCTSTKVSKELLKNSDQSKTLHTQQPSAECAAHAGLPENSLKPCPTCGEAVDLTNLKNHTKACLRANFLACKSASKVSKDSHRPEKVFTDSDPGEGSRGKDSVAIGSPYFCPTCRGDLSLLSMDQRNTHANRCLDNSLNETKEIKASKSETKKSKVARTKNSETARCPLCLKALTTHGRLKRHLVSCQKKNKFSTMTALALHRPEKGKEVDVELLAEIKRSEDRSAEPSTSAPSHPPKPKRKAPQKARAKKGIEAYNNEMMQLAIAVSNNEDIEKSKPKSKKKNEVFIPVMITLSPNSKRQQLQGRLRTIMKPEYSSSDEEIPSTPSLPTTSLRLSSVRANVRVISSINDRESTNANENEDNVAGPSGLGFEARQEGSQVQMQPIDNLELQQQRPNRTLGENESPDVPPPSTSRSNQNSPFKPHEDELQSPEVSSSNIRNTSVSDNGESPSTTTVKDPPLPKQELQCDSGANRKTNGRSPSKSSRWTMTSTRSENSLYRVRGLLSQFDKDRTKPLVKPISSVESKVLPCNGMSNSSEGSNEAGRQDEDKIDCTLLALEALDEDANEKKSDNVVAKSQSGSASETTTSFEKLIDNPQFSDAKILAGRAQDSINLHKNMLFCRCPQLLEEIVRSDDDTLHLPQFTKSEIMPLIHYIYMGGADSLILVAQTHKNLDKVLELMKRFKVNLPDGDQQRLEAFLKDERDAAQEKEPEVEEDTVNPSTANEVKNSKSDLYQEDLITLGGAVDVPDMMEESSFDEDVLPRCLTQKNPSPYNEFEEEIASDQDMFDFNQSVSKAVSDNTNSERRKSDSDMEPSFLENSPQEMSDHRNNEGEDNLEKESDVEEIEGYVGLTIEKGTQSTLTQTALNYNLPLMQGEDSKGNVSTSSLTSADTLIPTQEDSQDSNVSDSSLPSIKPLKRKRKVESPAMRRSKRRSSSLSRRHSSWRQCPCCAEKPAVYVGDRLPRLKQRPHIIDRIKINSQKLSSPKKRTPKKSPSTKKTFALGELKAAQRRKSDKKSRSQNTEKSSESGSEKEENGSKSLVSDDISPTKRCRKSPVLQRPSSNFAAARKSISRRERPSGSGQRSSDEMVYVSERLPRFKQREHIKSRPGVANMVKGINKSSKPTKTTPSAVVKRGENIQRKPVPKQRLSMSQPLEMKPMVEKNGSESPLPKKYKFKRVMLAGYASSSPISGSPSSNQEKNAELGSESEISGYDSDGGVFTDICFQDSFEQQCLHGLKTAEMPDDSAPELPNEFKTPQSDLRKSADGNCKKDGSSRSSYFGPVPITPMPDFNDMDTPEVVKRAAKIGLKKTLGKAKLKTKLEEEFLYKHQIVFDSEEEVSDHNIDGASREKVQNSEQIQEDDLRIDTAEVHKMKLKLSRLSASPNIIWNTEAVYSFSTLTQQELLDLSSKVVEVMHLDGSLLQALKNKKTEMGSIKRGSRQDQKRCWDIVTPGSSGYNPKLNAILCLPEEHQTAITAPLVGCVVKYYIEYKKYQFDCLPVVCDRMEKELASRRII